MPTLKIKMNTFVEESTNCSSWEKFNIWRIKRFSVSTNLSFQFLLETKKKSSTNLLTNTIKMNSWLPLIWRIFTMKSIWPWARYLWDSILSFPTKTKRMSIKKLRRIQSMRRLLLRTHWFGTILMLRKYSLLKFILKRMFQIRKYLKGNCCMFLQVQELSFLWIEYHSIFIVTLNVKFSMFLQNTNTWFLRIILRIFLSIQKDNSITSHLKRLEIFSRESKNQKWTRVRNIMVMPKEKVHKLKYLLSMVLE